MGSYIRYIINDDKDITFDAIESGLKSIDPDFNLSELDLDCGYAKLVHGTEIYGEMEITRLDQDTLDEEIEVLLEDVEDAAGGDHDRVKECLHHARVMLVVHVLWQGRDAQATLETIAPLWNWLFDNYQGLLQADGEGYFDLGQQILEME